MAKEFKQVDSFDYEQEFVNILKKQSKLNNFKNIKAFVDDANTMNECADDYSCIIACNLIDRLNNPKEFIKLIKQKIAQGGLIIIIDPYNWSEEFTQLQDWLGGYRKAAERYFSIEGLTEAFGPEFKCYQTDKIPFLIHNIDGGYDYIYSEATVWGPI